MAGDSWITPIPNNKFGWAMVVAVTALPAVISCCFLGILHRVRLTSVGYAAQIEIVYNSLVVGLRPTFRAKTDAKDEG